MQSVFRIRILLASPGNLSEDRKKVSDIVKYINLDNGQREGFVAEIVSWETHSRPAAGEYPQAVINVQFPDDIDIFIGLMGTYFGKPTKKWGSGTEEEFRIAYESWEKTSAPEIMFYFSDAMSSLSQIDPEQLLKRNSFRDELGDLGVYYFAYTDVVEFQFDLHNHISSAIHDVLKDKKPGQDEEAIPQESTDKLKNYNSLLAQNPLINAASLFDKGSYHLNSFNALLSALTSDIKKLTGVISKEAKNIERVTRNNKPDKVTDSIRKIHTGMNEYSRRILEKIPKLSSEFSDAILISLRAVTMVKINSLEDQIPLSVIVSSVASARGGLTSLIESITQTEAVFVGWADASLGLDIEKQTLIALHQDLVVSLRKSIELMDKLTQECAN